jgi:serine phosphatase RsbU (regulator of sigma subunit)
LLELQIGNAIQRDLLRGELSLGVKGVCLASLSKPSLIVDGDFSVIHRLQADCFDVLVGDVMGKGVPAALIGAGIRATYHQVLADLLLNSPDRQALPTPAQMVNQLHQLLTPRLAELASFASLALYRFDLGANTLTYVNAGHTPGLLLRAQQTSAMLLTGENLPIGVLPAEVYAQSEVALSQGDRFLSFSDGITEARNAQGEEFGQSRLTAIFESWSGSGDGPCNCQARLASVSQTLQRYADNAYVMDDQTLLLVELLAIQPNSA